jgi:hypothetical protein
LIKDAILLHENFLKDYYKLLEKDHLNKTKRNITYGFDTFFSVYIAFTKENETYLKNYFFSRKKDNRKTLVRQTAFTIETIKLASTHLEKDICLRIGSEVHIPIYFIILESM